MYIFGLHTNNFTIYTLRGLHYIYINMFACVTSRIKQLKKCSKEHKVFVQMGREYIRICKTIIFDWKHVSTKRPWWIRLERLKLSDLHFDRINKNGDLSIYSGERERETDCALDFDNMYSRYWSLQDEFFNETKKNLDSAMNDLTRQCDLTQFKKYTRHSCE